MQTHIPPEKWQAKDAHAFTTHRDPRDLLVIEHPWVPSRAGGFGEWKTNIAPPEGWRPGAPLFLSFYQSDNYCGESHDSAWMGTQAFNGHRFKQLYVNGRLVWESDVADEEMVDPDPTVAGSDSEGAGYTDPYRLVKITDCVDRNIELTFRVVDKVASTKRMPGDAYSRFSWSPFDPKRAVKNFQTSVYFGDVHVTTDGSVARPGGSRAPANEKPSESERRVPAERITFSLAAPAIAPRDDFAAVSRQGAYKETRFLLRGRKGRRISLASPESLPAPGFPVRSGVPLPRGEVAAGTPFALRDSGKELIPLATTETSHWPDGSIRWLLCEFVATRRGNFTLVPGIAPPAPATPVRIRKGGKWTSVSNGVIKLKLGDQAGDGVFGGLSCDGGIAVGPMDLCLKLNRVGWRDHFRAHRRHIAVERSNAVCAVIRVDGEFLDREGTRFGPWQARLHLWAQLPYLVIDWRVVNESDQAMAALLDWSARLSLPDLSGATLDFGPFEPGHDPEDVGSKAMGHYDVIEDTRAVPLHRESEISCRQERADHARIYRNTSWVATAARAPGYVNVRHPEGGLVASMKWFAEEFPKGIVARPDLLSLATLPEYEDALGWPHDRPQVRLGRGEAKTQSFALWLHNGKLSSLQAERFNRCVQDQPHLFNPTWFVASEALDTGPSRDSAGLEQWSHKITPVMERTGIGAPRLGHREYWDTCWSNDYRGRAHLGLLQYVETGDARWHRYFEAACAHNRDIDIIHYCPEHPNWVGATHSYGEDHTSCGPMGNIGLNVDSLLEHYLMTGNPDSLDAARGLAERVLECSHWSRSARAVGWPLSQIVRWYEHTGDPRYLEKSREFVTAAKALIEPRRGIFNEKHGCWNYRGAVPFMTGYLAFGLIRYHRLIGDADTLRLLCLVADGLFAESRVGPGRFRYSPFPENNKASGSCRGWNGLIGGLAGYLFLVTGSEKYGEWAQECYDEVVADAEDIPITLDMCQLAGWMLHAVVRLSRRRGKGRRELK